MAKPVIQTINPFDADKGSTVSFTWSGNRISSNTLYVYNNSTNDLEYSNTITSASTFSNIISSGYLTNGTKYYAVIKVTDYTGNTYTSEKALFYCYTTPTFRFENFQSTIEGSSYIASVYYYSPDGETFNFCNFYLYDYDTGTDEEDSVQLYKSAEISMSTSGEITYTYRGLENHNYYWMRALGTTIHGMEVDTGYKKCYIDIANEDTYAPIYAENDADLGCIHVYTNVVVISSVRDEDDYSYIDSEYIDLREDSVQYVDLEPFSDFTAQIIGADLWDTQTILTVSNGEDSFELSSRIYYNSENYPDGYLRFKLTAPIEHTPQYIIYSDPCVFTDSDYVTIFLRRENNIYQIVVLDYSFDEEDLYTD